MTFTPNNQSGYTKTKTRSTKVSPQSGICSMCTDTCAGTCEIAQSAILGMRTVYPITTGSNQIASEKDYPLDYSHFNINGRVFGAFGTEETFESANIHNVDICREYGSSNKIKMLAPFFLPALIKLNWKDYFSGAAMAGVSCVIGEGAFEKDPNLVMQDGKITSFPWLSDILESFNKYYRGYGQIILQVNLEDDFAGVTDIALEKYDVQAIEIKFGQSAKGTQPVNFLKNIEEAQIKVDRGYIVYPDPYNEKTITDYKKNVCPNFYSYSRLPLWTEESLKTRITEMRKLGAKNIYFKMAGYDIADIKKVIKIACDNAIDMITFDGAGGGSGYSPSKMMNEWSLPTVTLEKIVCDICRDFEKQGYHIPAITMTGGFSSEDQVFKALALGDNRITAIGLCRASMTAAMTGKTIGEKIKQGQIPKEFEKFGTTVEEIFQDLADLRAIYGCQANGFPTGAIGVYSYLNRLAFGIRHFGALNRKFDINLWNQTDLIPLTSESRKILSEN